MRYQLCRNLFFLIGLISLNIFLTVFINSAQAQQWKNYTNGSFVTALVDNDTHIWIGTNGGLVKIEKDSNQKSFINRANSGLPNNFINSLAFDKKGCLWIGTYSGLTSFDGQIWTHYNTTNSLLPSNYINELVVNKDNAIWLATKDAGIVRFDGETWVNYNKMNSDLPDNEIWAIAVDHDNNIWITVKNEGCIKFDGLTMTFFKEFAIDYSRKIAPLVVDHDNTLWAGASGGLIKYDGDTWTWYDRGNSDLPGALSSLAVDSKNHVWVGTKYGLGIGEFDGFCWKNYNVSNSPLSGHWIEFIAVDENDNKWIVSRNWRGEYILQKFGADGWNRYITSNSVLRSNRIHEIKIDIDNNIWIATKGLVKFDQTNWVLYDPFNQPEVVLKTILNIDFDQTGVGWISSINKVVKYKESIFTDPVSIGVGIGFINALILDPQGNLWLGGEVHYGGPGYAGVGGGLVKYDGSDAIQYTTSNSELPSNTIWALAWDDGSVWIGTDSEGVSQFDGKSWLNYNTANSGLPNDRVRSLAIDNNGNLWVGTEGGLARFDGTDWLCYTMLNSDLPHNDVRAIAFENEIVWVGTCGGGLCKFSGDSWKIFSTENSGLPGNNVMSIAVDNFGQKWIGTKERGIAVYRESDNVLNLNNSSKPKIFSLLQNYPNPFNAGTTIEFDLARESYVTLTIFNLKGDLIKSLITRRKFINGSYHYIWDGTNDARVPVASGVYFYRLQVGPTFQTKKGILIK
ncbi:T9SS type A sorting domain-containing protein [candidate division KSB1 bacterium]|nr:T9SS type A sorting domain-containing protein [candidate division KSB1 bacterium]